MQAVDQRFCVFGTIRLLLGVVRVRIYSHILCVGSQSSASSHFTDALPMRFTLPNGEGRVAGSSIYVEAVTALSVSTKKDKLLTCGLDGLACLWSLTHSPKLKLQPLSSFCITNRIGSCALSSSGDRALIASEGFLKVLDVHEAQPVQLGDFSQTADINFSKCCFLPRSNEQCILGLDYDATCLWDLREGKLPVRCFKGIATTFATSMCGSVLVTANAYDGAASYWDLRAHHDPNILNCSSSFFLGSAIDSRGVIYLLSETGLYYGSCMGGSFLKFSTPDDIEEEPSSHLAIDWEADVLCYSTPSRVFVFDVSSSNEVQPPLITTLSGDKYCYFNTIAL